MASILRAWNLVIGGARKITSITLGTKEALCTTQVDANGKVPGESGYTGPVVQSREPACFVSITASDLESNVYTVTGDPAVGYDIINDSAGPITVAVSDGTTTITKTLNPDDSDHQTFEIDVETITFSAGAVFRADLLR